MQKLKDFGIVPVDFNTIANTIGNYKSPGDRISKLKKSNVLIRLKKGLYVVSPEITNQSISNELLANHLYGPSYISLESALSYYGLIPERVYSTLSVTSKRSKKYVTPLGVFEYKSVPPKYFSVGTTIEIDSNKAFAFLIASPEKAVCDLILTKSGLRIQSLKGMSEFLHNDLRIEFDAVSEWDLSVINQCMQYGYKKTELGLLTKIVEHERSI